MESARKPVVSAVVLAAGLSTRMGEQKLLLPIDTRPMIRHVVEAALRSSVDEVIIVVGPRSEDLLGLLLGLRVKTVENPDPARGMSSSLQCGLRAVRSDCGAVVFLLGDQPFVTGEVIDLLVARFRERPALIVRPAIDGRPVHPVLMASVLFPEILEQSGDVGGREVIARHSDEVELVCVDDRLVGLDVDTAEDYEAASMGVPAREEPDAL